jgi:phage terminase large subunit
METKVKRIDTFYHFFRKNEDKKILTLYGGAGSGKSQSIIEELLEILLTHEDIRILVARKTTPSLDKTALQMFKDTVVRYGKEKDVIISGSPKQIRYGKSIIWFTGLDEPEKVKSLNLNYAYLEEATEFTEDDFIQIRLRLRRENKYGPNRMYLSFNPTLPYHWTAKMISSPPTDTGIHHSTYKNNPFLPEAYTDVLEKFKETNPNTYRIYTLGQFGMPENIVYSHWQEFENQPPLYDSIIVYGLDFGFTNPSALVEVRYYQGAFYVTEHLYKSKLTNNELINKIIYLRETGFPIYCDSAEPARIAELGAAGINASESDKNVIDGINYVRSSPLFINKNSINLIKEIQSYQFRMDKKKMVMEQPEKGNDHCLDAMRYAIYSMRVTPGMPSPVSEQVKNIPGLDRKKEMKEVSPIRVSLPVTKKGRIPGL